MKTTFGKILQNSYSYGLILGGCLIVFILLVYLFDINLYSIIGGILSFIILVLAVPIPIVIISGNHLRKKYSPENRISYLDVLINSFILLVIGFMLSNIFSYILVTLIAPGYIDHQIVQFTEMMERYQVSADDVNKGIERIESQTNILRSLGRSLIISAILALLISLVVRRKDKVVD